MPSNAVQYSRIVRSEEWLRARRELLVQENKLTRLRDDLNRQRRVLPWSKLRRYLFAAPHGKETLADLFGGRSQLIVAHFKQPIPAWLHSR